MKDFIYWLEEMQKENVQLVGTKAANLAELAREVRVPAGFCLSSLAYSRNLAYYGIDKQIEEILKRIEQQSNGILKKASEEITKLIISMPLLPEVEEEINKAYLKLIDNKETMKVAVRSSATAEDLADASFAGLQETFLNIDNIENLFSSVKKCWASLWTERAIDYRNKKGFNHFQVQMAIIIQEMIPSEVSGVMFTANPVNNHRNEMRIEAVRGLGEKLVSGETAGDVYILKKSDTNVEIASITVSDNEKGPMLSDYTIRELAHYGLKIELYYENFQDIEWAFYRGNIYFLQTRPITTLAEEELENIDLAEYSVVQRELVDWVAERYPEPIFPIEGVIVKIMFTAQFEAMREFGYKIGEVDWSLVEKGIFPEFFKPPVITKGLKRLLVYARLNSILKTNPVTEWSAEQIYLLDMLDKLKSRDISKLPLEIISEYLTEALNHFHYFMVIRYRYFAQNRIAASYLKMLLGMAFVSDFSRVYEDLFAGSDNISIEINRNLEKLSEEAKAIPEVKKLISQESLDKVYQKLDQVEGGSLYKDHFDQFLVKYGDRETKFGLGGIASPTWREEPEVVFGIIKSMFEIDPDFKAQSMRTGRAKIVEEIALNCFSKGLYAVFNLKSLLRKLIDYGRNFNTFRENSHLDVTKGLQVFRILYIELGKRFVRRGILEKETDIFYFTYYEIKEMINVIYDAVNELNPKSVKLKIIKRMEERERRLKRWRLRHKETEQKKEYSGVPVSLGVATGPARLIRDVHDFNKVTKGDIIIAPFTTPSWTPLFAIAAGLVAETGGAASHVAIIAREYGIPAVMGISGVTETIHDGEIITVDGYTGNIFKERAL